MRKLTHSELVEQRLDPDGAIHAERFPVALIVHDIRSLYNVGSIFRSADAFRCSIIALSGYTPVPPRKEISKTALGADLTVPWKYFATAEESIHWLKAAGYHICALELTTNSRPIEVARPDAIGMPVAFLLGNELTGIDDTLLHLCDSAAEIPMHGAKHSLNVAVATGIALYAATLRIPAQER